MKTIETIETIELFTKALKIEAPFFIETIIFKETEKKIEIHINFKPGSTFAYHHEDTNETTYHKAYDTEQKKWRHLNFLQYQCYLIVRTPRIQKPTGGICQILPPWAGKLYGFTLMFEAYVMTLVKHMPVHHVAKLVGTYDQKIWKLLDCYVTQGQSFQDYQNVTCLGLDETSVAKGHQYITLFVELHNRRTIGIVEGKEHETVTEFVEFFKDMNGDPDQIKDVSCDMSPAFTKLAKTIKKHKEGILQWKLTQINNGILEGLNSVIQAAKRKAHGYGAHHFRIMALFLTGKINFSHVNPYLPTHF